MSWNDNKFKTRVGTCKDCTDRKVGCHSTCERYMTAKKEWDAEKDRIDKERGKQSDYNNQHYNGVAERRAYRKKMESKR